MTWIAAAFLVIAFLVLLQLLRVPAVVAEIGATGRLALQTLRDRALDDAAKEKVMRAGSLRLLLLFVRIALRTAVALAVPAGVVALLAAVDVVDFETVLARTLSWQILVGATVLGLLAMRLLPRRTS